MKFKKSQKLPVQIGETNGEIVAIRRYTPIAIRTVGEFGAVGCETLTDRRSE